MTDQHTLRLSGAVLGVGQLVMFAIAPRWCRRRWIGNPVATSTGRTGQ